MIFRNTLRIMRVAMVCCGAAAFAAAAAAASQDVNALSGKDWDVRAHGAKGDGRTLDTQAIQAAVDACAGAGGGTVRLSGGTFLSGTIRLRSHVTLNIDSGATLLGSADIKDYPSITPGIVYLYRPLFTKSLIYAEGAEGIALTGRGAIDGQGKLFPAKPADHGARPYLIRFSECRNVQVRELTLRNSARWLSHYLACENVTIDGITIDSFIRENRDGMDIDSCDRVRIANCDIQSGDDSIVLKSTAQRPCRRVTVTNCTLRSGASALKLGTESQGGFEDITFSNCAIYDTKGTAISLGEVDGGVCARISVSNIVMSHVACALLVRLGNRATPIPGQPAPGIGAMRDITLCNIQADGVGAIGTSFAGLPDHPIENLTLENIRIRCAGGGTAQDAARTVPEKEKSYPNGGMFGTLPAYGLYCRHIQGLRLHNIDLAYAKNDARPAVVVDDMEDLDISGLRAKISNSAGALLRLLNVRGALIHDCQAPGGIDAFLGVAGARSGGIRLYGNELSATGRPVVLSQDVPAGAVSTETSQQKQYPQ